MKPLHEPDTRRDFVKKSLATSAAVSFAGLIRAHGEEGGGTTTWNPEQTTVATTDGQTTTWNPDYTTFETTAGETTTWDPEETTVQTTTNTTGQTHVYDIFRRSLTCTLEELQSVAGAETPDYLESLHFQVPLPSPSRFEGLNPPCELKCKLKAWSNPVSLTPHPTTATVEFVAELFGYWPTGNDAISIRSARHEFKGVCDSSTGQITPSLEEVAEAEPNSGTWTITHPDDELTDWKVKVYITNLEMTPQQGSATLVKLNGTMFVEWQVSPLGTGFVTYGTTTEKEFEFVFESHEHS